MTALTASHHIYDDIMIGVGLDSAAAAAAVECYLRQSSCSILSFCTSFRHLNCFLFWSKKARVPSTTVL